MDENCPTGDRPGKQLSTLWPKGRFTKGVSPQRHERSRRSDSNRRPIPYKGIALPAELLRQPPHRRRDFGCPKRTRPSRCVCNLGNMEHPKDVGDRSTLAIITVLRELGYGVYLPFGENTRCDLILERGEQLSRVQCKTGRLRQGAIAFAVCSCYGHHRNPTTARRVYTGQIDPIRCLLPRHGRRLPDPDRGRANQERCVPPRRPAAQQPARARPLRRRLRDRARRYRRTSRVFWCVTIFRFTRWSALSIVFVSHSSCSAISSYDDPSR